MMDSESRVSDNSIDLRELLRIDGNCLRFEYGWKSGKRPNIEDVLADASGRMNAVLFQHLLKIELTYRERLGENLKEADYIYRFPDRVSQIKWVFEERSKCQPETEASTSNRPSICKVTDPQVVSTDNPRLDIARHPNSIGRYLIEHVLGEGGFGLVYLARDDQLNRRVAVKVPHPKLVARREDAEAYLVEARTVASLDHFNIVPVYDVGSTPEFPYFVVSKYISGGIWSSGSGTHLFR